MKLLNYDVIVVGSGIAGLFFALETVRRRPSTRIAIITKKGETDSSTNWAQGGIAAVLGTDDSFELHAQDTLIAGAGLCKEAVVRRVVGMGPEVIADLDQLGVGFSRNADGSYALGREGGHSRFRVAHAADLTGKEIERALLQASHARRPEFFEDHMVVNLIVADDPERQCMGVVAYSEVDNELVQFHAPVTLLATGGLGQVYSHTTNPRIATGDGVAIAWRAGVAVANLEMIQFHPTALYAPGRWPFLISEAVRGEGARLKSIDGRYFMQAAHPMADLAPRDIVARAIDRELKSSGQDHVLLEINQLPAEQIQARFPGIYATCLQYGFDITRRPIPVVPAAHYSCGGVLADLSGRTSLDGLLVAGEVAMSGMHGANRLASNSLLEAVVMAKLAAIDAVKRLEAPRAALPRAAVQTIDFSKEPLREQIVVSHERKRLQQIMSDFVGIVRTRERLAIGLERIRHILQTAERLSATAPPTYAVLELRNLATVAELIVLSARKREESRGLHFLEGVPETPDLPAVDTILEPLPFQSEVVI